MSYTENNYSPISGKNVYDIHEVNSYVLVTGYFGYSCKLEAIQSANVRNTLILYKPDGSLYKNVPLSAYQLTSAFRPTCDIACRQHNTSDYSFAPTDKYYGEAFVNIEIHNIGAKVKLYLNTK